MPVVVAVVISLLFVVASVHAATTISTDILTGGNVNATGTLAVTGVSSLYGNLNINGFATTTAASGNFATQGNVTTVGHIWASSTLAVTGVTSHYGNVNFNGFATTTVATGNIATAGDVTVEGRDVTVTTTNTSTSTIEVGCIQTYATSTLTPVRLELGSIAAATTTFGTAGVGFVAWRYGACH